MGDGVAFRSLLISDMGLIKVADRLETGCTLLLKALFVCAVISDELRTVFVITQERLIVFLVPALTSQSFLKRKVVYFAFWALLPFLTKESGSCRLTRTLGCIMRASPLPGSLRHRRINLFQAEFVLNDIFFNVGNQIRRSQERKLKTQLYFHSINLKWHELTAQLATRLHIV